MIGNKKFFLSFSTPNDVSQYFNSVLSLSYRFYIHFLNFELCQHLHKWFTKILPHEPKTTKADQYCVDSCCFRELQYRQTLMVNRYCKMRWRECWHKKLQWLVGGRTMGLSQSKDVVHGKQLGSDWWRHL